MSAQYDSIIQEASKKYGVDAALIKAVIQAESGFDKDARSSAGAGGLMQLMPQTAKGLGVDNVFDPYQNIMGGTKYLSQLSTMFGGDLTKILAGYNAGPGNVNKYGGVPPFAETIKYVQKVKGYYNGSSPFTGGSTDKSDKGGLIAGTFNGIVRFLLLLFLIILSLTFFMKAFPASDDVLKAVNPL